MEEALGKLEGAIVLIEQMKKLDPENFRSGVAATFIDALVPTLKEIVSDIKNNLE